jgi:CRP-like cAMP-binding protein
MSDKQSYCTIYTKQEIKEIVNTVLKKHINIDESFAKILKIKSKIRIFKGITQDTSIVGMLLKVKLHRYNRGEVIIQDGSLSKEMYFILSGTCNVLKSNNKVGSIPSGSSVGEIAAIFNKARNATVEAAEEVVVIRFEINHAKMHKFPLEFAILYKNIASELADKIALSNKKIP